jgi:hypothetical protein
MAATHFAPVSPMPQRMATSSRSCKKKMGLSPTRRAEIGFTVWGLRKVDAVGNHYHITRFCSARLSVNLRNSRKKAPYFSYGQAGRDV